MRNPDGLNAVAPIGSLQIRSQPTSWRKKWQFKFFVYVHPDMPLEETTERVMWLKEHECLPYLMRDIACWSSLNRTWYANMAAWCNQPGLFKNMDFKTFVERRS